MGNKASSSNKMILDTSTSVEVTNETMSSNRSSTTQSAGGLQVFTLSMQHAKVRSSNFRLNQTIQMDQSIFTNITDTLISNLQSNITQTLDAAVDQASKSKTDFGAFGSSSASDTVTEIKTALRAAVRDKVQKETVIEQVQSIVNTQLMTLDWSQIDIANSNIEITQDMVVKQISKNIITSIIQKANTTLLTGSSKVQLEQKSDAATSGIGDMWSSLMGFLGVATGTGGNVSMITSSVISCIVCILLIGLVIVLLSPAGQNAIGTGADALAMRAGGGGAGKLLLL